MDLCDLRKRLSDIKSEWHILVSMQDQRRIDLPPSPLLETVLAAYRDRVLKDDRIEKALMSSDVDPVTYLSQVLEENWRLVKGTCLSYTAIPTDPITRLLCDFAIFCAENKPSADTRSTAVSSCEQAPAELSSLAAGGVAAVDSLALKPAILYLMPSLQSIISNGQIQSLPNLGALPLPELLTTHIEICDGHYLYPVVPGLLSLKPVDQAQASCDINPYWNGAEGDAEHVHISTSDQLRLKQYSDDIIQYVAQHDNCARLARSSTSLYDRLLVLRQALSANGVGRHGDEGDAAVGAYSAIIDFDTYYQALIKERGADIPGDVDREITYLLELSSDADENDDATESMDTCIDIRGAKMAELISANQVALKSIDFKGAHSLLIPSNNDSLKKMAASLVWSVKDDRYVSYDLTLGLSEGLLKALEVELQCNNFEDVSDLLIVFPANNLRVLLQGDLIFRCAEAIATIDNLVWCFVSSNPENITVFLELLLAEDRLAQQFFPDMDAVLSFLKVLSTDVQGKGIVIEKMMDYLPRIMRGWSDILHIVGYLLPGQYQASIELLLGRLPSNRLWVVDDCKGLMDLLVRDSYLLKSNTVLAALTALDTTAEGKNQNLSAIWYLAATHATCGLLMQVLVDHPELLVNPDMQTALTALPTSAAGEYENKSAIWYLAANHATRDLLMQVLVDHPELLVNPDMQTALTALPTRAAGGNENISVIWYLAATNATRDLLMQVLVDHPELLVNPDMQTALTALPTSAAGEYENKSAIWHLAAYKDTRGPFWWLAAYKPTRDLLMQVLVDHPELLVNPDLQTALTALPTRAAGEYENKSAIWHLAAYNHTRGPLIQVLVDHPGLLVNRDMQTALTALPTSAAGGSENKSAIWYFTRNHATFGLLMQVLVDHPELLVNPDMRTLLTALPTSAAGINQNKSVIWWLAIDHAARGFLMQVLVDHPELFVSSGMQTLLTALPTNTAGIHQNKSVIWWLVHYKETSDLLMQVLVDHPELLVNPELQAALTALPTSAAGEYENKSAIWYLAAYKDTRGLLMRVLVDHPELLVNPDMQTALTALPTSAAVRRENKSAIWFFAANHGTFGLLMQVLVDHPELLVNPDMQTALTALPTSAAGSSKNKSVIWWLVSSSSTRGLLMQVLVDHPELLDNPDMQTALRALPDAMSGRYKYKSAIWYLAATHARQLLTLLQADDAALLKNEVMLSALTLSPTSGVSRDMIQSGLSCLCQDKETRVSLLSTLAGFPELTNKACYIQLYVYIREIKDSINPSSPALFDRPPRLLLSTVEALFNIMNDDGEEVCLTEDQISVCINDPVLQSIIDRNTVLARVLTHQIDVATSPSGSRVDFMKMLVEHPESLQIQAMQTALTALPTRAAGLNENKSATCCLS